jgi:hypothetical protein
MKHKVNTSMEDQQKTQESKPVEPVRPTRPNENAGFAVMGHIKIFDPNSKEVVLEARE